MIYTVIDGYIKRLVGWTGLALFGLQHIITNFPSLIYPLNSSRFKIFPI